MTKLILDKYPIKQVPYVIINKREKVSISDFPVIVKPANGGSSIGISVANNRKELKNALKIVLMKNGYNYVDISIDINKNNSSDTGIYLKIPKCKNYDVNNIKQIVEKETGLNPKILYYQ